MGVVVDGPETGAIGGFAVHEPFGASIIDLSVHMAILDRLLDVGGVESPLLETVLRVPGPDEALDLHG